MQVISFYFSINSQLGDVVHPDTVTSFIEAFKICGLNPQAFRAGYGLAEHCCGRKFHGFFNLVEIGAVLNGKTFLHVNKTELELNHVVVPGNCVVSSCGKSEPDVHVVIVDPTTKKRLHKNCVGEIWLNSPSVAIGYWKNPELTKAAFGYQTPFSNQVRATIEGEEDMKYLRTGDYGFLDDNGRLYITGRLKDLLYVVNFKEFSF